jgi:hypothetical protein
MRTPIVLTQVALIFAGAPAFAADRSPEPSGFEIAVDADGALKLPDVDFRAAWTMLGSWAVDGGRGAEGMHIVYTQPGVAAAFRDTGAFPDGTVLIKELRAAATEALTTGTVSYASDLQGWFVMVKDGASRYQGHPLWGDGWGWGFFAAEDPSTLATEDYVLECKACHVPAEATDWVYTRAYPALRDD